MEYKERFATREAPGTGLFCRPIKTRLINLIPLFCVSLLLATVSANDVTRDLARVVRETHDHHEYGVVIDAGSSGSRVWVYRWPPLKRRWTLPKIETVFTDRVTPGLADFADSIEEMSKIIQNLVNVAKRHVPLELQADSSIYLLATAGMRLLWEDQSTDVFNKLRNLLEDKSVNPFRVESEHSTRILSGEEEGVFAWIATNYHTGVFSSRAGVAQEKTVGILELGGASTQIAFIPQGNALANKFSLRLAGKRYPLYVHSYLHFGQDYVDRWIKEHLNTTGRPPGAVIDNPCMLRGHTQSDAKRANRTYIGTGQPDICIQLLKQRVYKVEPSRCYPKPCAIGSTYQPTLPPDKTFIALGAFVRSLKSFKAVSDNGSLLLTDSMERAKTFCARSFDDVRKDVKNPSHEKFLSLNCLSGLYLHILFTTGYGFSLNTTNILALDEINNKELDWTLGALLYEREYIGELRYNETSERRAVPHCTCGATITVHLNRHLVFCLLAAVTYLIPHTMRDFKNLL